MIANTLLMVRPANFGFNNQSSESNVFQNKIPNLNAQQIQEIAELEFDNYVKLLKENGIEVLVYNDTLEPPKPDAIFPNNWFCTLPNSKDLFLFPMLNENRRIEKRSKIYKDLILKYNLKLNDALLQFEKQNEFLEGTGSLVLDHQNKIAYAVKSARTTTKALNKWCETTGYQPITFNAIDENNLPIYHTNVMMCVADEYVVICLDAIKDAKERQNVIDTIAIKTQKGIIKITMEQMCKYFMGNMLQVQNKSGDKFLVMSNSSFNNLEDEQLYSITDFFNNAIITVPINLIETIGGGSARCMIAEIFY